MTKGPGSRDDPIELRRRAEARVAKRTKTAHRLSAPEAQRLLHELEVHQMELELQNEELRAARVELEAALERYTELFDYAPIGYAMLHRRGVIAQVNHAGARLLGHTRAELVNRMFASTLAGTDQVALVDLLRLAATSDRQVVAEVRLEGSDRQLRLTAIGLPRAQPMVLLAFEDVTERNVAAAQLAESDHALRDADRRKDDFLAVLSHELRNPLAPMRSSIFVLGKVGADSPEGRQALEILDRQVTHLARMVDDLFDVSRITRGKIELRRQRLDLVPLVRATLEDLRGVFDDAHIRLEGELDVGPLWVQADPARLVQILTNLLGNAMKYTPTGGAVALSLRPEGARAVLRLRDTGPGIAPEVRGHLFEPFVQGPQPADRPAGGLGLGLVTAKGLVELHGGTVGVSSEGPGLGTELTIILPLAGTPAEAARPAEVEKVRPRRVLIIEDSRDFAQGLQAVLALKGHEVEIALDGAAGIELARQFRPEIVLCDLGLPRMDGYRVAHALRADPDLRHVCVIALSGYVRPELDRRIADAGFDDQLAKPPDLEKLDRIIDGAP